MREWGRLSFRLRQYRVTHGDAVAHHPHRPSLRLADGEVAGVARRAGHGVLVTFAELLDAVGDVAVHLLEVDRPVGKAHLQLVLALAAVAGAADRFEQRHGEQAVPVFAALPGLLAPDAEHMIVAPFSSEDMSFSRF